MLLLKVRSSVSLDRNIQHIDNTAVLTCEFISLLDITEMTYYIVCGGA